jgi:hypothetical protein
LRWVLLLALAVVSLRGSELVSKRSPPGG